MPPRQLHRLIHAATRSTSTDSPVAYSRLRNQIAERRVHIPRPFLLNTLVDFLGRHLVKRCPPALPESSKIHRQHIHSRRRQSSRQVVPHFSLPVTLVQQQHAGPRLSCRKICSLQHDSIRRFEFKHARRRCFGRINVRAHQQPCKQNRASNPRLGQFVAHRGLLTRPSLDALPQ